MNNLHFGKVVKLGNSHAIILPQVYTKKLDIKRGEFMKFVTDKQTLQITPMNSTPKTKSIIPHIQLTEKDIMQIEFKIYSMYFSGISQFRITFKKNIGKQVFEVLKTLPDNYIKEVSPTLVEIEFFERELSTHERLLSICHITQTIAKYLPENDKVFLTDCYTTLNNKCMSLIRYVHNNSVQIDKMTIKELGLCESVYYLLKIIKSVINLSLSGNKITGLTSFAEYLELAMKEVFGSNMLRLSSLQKNVLRRRDTYYTKVKKDSDESDWVMHELYKILERIIYLGINNYDWLQTKY